jgi:putative membrane protein
VVAAAFAVVNQRHLFRSYHSHSLLVWFLLVLVLAALLVVAVGAILVTGRGPRGRSETEAPLIPPSPPSSAEQILAGRLARGEIDADEYRRRRDALRN